MSSPANRHSRRASQNATPRRSVRSSIQPVASSSPAPVQQNGEERSASSGNRPSQLRQNEKGSVASSSPLFYRSSPAPRSVASSDIDGTTRTPRAAVTTMGDSSPIHYMPSSSPMPGLQGSRASRLGLSSTNLLSDSSAAGPRGSSARYRRGDVNSDSFGSDALQRARRNVNGHAAGDSDAATFSNLNPDTSDADLLGGNSQRILWGTKISVADTRRVFKDFLLNYESRYRLIKDGVLGENEVLPSDHPGHTKEYLDMMGNMLQLGTTALNLDLRNLAAYPSTVKLWHQFQGFPQEIIPLMDDTIKDTMIDLAERRMLLQRTQRQQPMEGRTSLSSSVPPLPSSDAAQPEGGPDGNYQSQDGLADLVRDTEMKVYRVRPFGLDKSINLRDLNPGDIDKVVSVKGLVIRASPIIPDMKEAFFKCAVCNHTVRVELDRGKISEPTQCPREACQSANSMQIVHNRCEFADKQVIKLQETPDSIPDGQTPHSVSICAYDELVDFCKAGDRVEITGIFKCNQVRINPRQRSVKNIFKTFVDAVHIQKVDKRRLGIDASTLEQELSEQISGDQVEVRRITAEDEEKIKATAARPDVYELLSRSLAPSIYELDDVKKGILLQLFGGTNKSFEKGGNPKYRGDINVLLCGDPSTAKSQLLQYVHKIAPRGVYTSGKGSSAVGLTAYVTRDPETRQLVLESGALVLSDGGVCCIDEFDKMSESTRSVLHEVMEQQTVSIAKAGIITTLNARTSILASANPIGSKYNPNLPVPQNIDLPPTLLSRFDLVYLVLDRVDEQNDRRLAKHLIGMYLEDTPENASSREILPVEFLTAYISYVRTNCHPRITQEASDELVRAYVEMRKLGEDVRAAERRITATTRQLESMIRLSEAHAKMRLSPEVTAADVVEAVRLIKSALKQAATDSRTGLIDMSLLTEGTSASERHRKQDMKNAIISLLDDMTRQGGNVRYADLAKRLGEQSSVAVEVEELTDIMRALQQEGQLQIIGEGARRSIRRVTGAGV